MESMELAQIKNWFSKIERKGIYMLKWLLPHISPKSLMVRREGYAFLLRPGNFEINQSRIYQRGRWLI
jgi:hypothetical protein